MYSASTGLSFKRKKYARFVLLLTSLYFISKGIGQEWNIWKHFGLVSHSQTEQNVTKTSYNPSFERIDSQDLQPYATKNGSDKIIWFTTANENYAQVYLPIFLDSLRQLNATLASKFLVVTFSKNAQSICLKIHHLCPIFVESFSGELNSKLNYFARQGDQTHWRNFVWTTVEARLYVLRQGYSYIHIDCDVFHLKDPWELVKNHLGEGTWISSNSIQAKLSDANPGIQYVSSGKTGLTYVRKWFAQRSKMATPSGNQRALTTLLAKDNRMAAHTKLYPCTIVSNACCLRECCSALWEKLDAIDPHKLYLEIHENERTKWLSKSVMFHAACLGGTPMKKMRRYKKIYDAISFRIKE